MLSLKTLHRRKTMNVTKAVKDIVQFITEGFLEIFRANDDSYPAVGLQPYGGTISARHSRYEW